jgi:hypothetical protein
VVDLVQGQQLRPDVAILMNVQLTANGQTLEIGVDVAKPVVKVSNNGEELLKCGLKDLMPNCVLELR